MFGGGTGGAMGTTIQQCFKIFPWYDHMLLLSAKAPEPKQDSLFETVQTISSSTCYKQQLPESSKKTTS
jgi:hypothetical protein